MRDDFVIFILSHGRADNMKTVKTLEKSGYTGKWYIICDNEDETLNDYYKNFGKDRVIVFDKKAKAEECDTFDTIDERRVILFARNAAFDLAKQMQLKYFLELDDDYEVFRYRYEDGEKFTSKVITNLDLVINLMLDYLDEANLTSVAFGQTGDYIGGSGSQLFQSKIKRKAMNTFFCRTDRKFDFLGRFNEDVCTYTLLGSRGDLFFTIADISLEQTETQNNKGGMTEAYVNLGTYMKSFYTVICMPSAVKIAMMRSNHPRIHHTVDWESCVPKIISYKFKKSS